MVGPRKGIKQAAFSNQTQLFATMEFSCQLPSHEKTERVEFALCASPNVLGIDAFIATLNIDDRHCQLNKFWSNVDLAQPIVLTNSTIKWVGFNGILSDQKKMMNKLLKKMKVETKTVSSLNAETVPEIREDISACNESNRTNLRWTVVSGLDFKRACLLAQTKRSAELVDRFIAVETIRKLYRTYQKHAEARSLARSVEESIALVRSSRLLRMAHMESTIASTTKMAALNLEIAKTETVVARKRVVEAIGAMEVERTASKRKLEAVALRVVPAPKNPRYDEVLAVIKMGDAYARAVKDPRYLLDCNYVFVRVQRCALKARLAQIRGYGRKSNMGAVIVDERLTPNARQLFRRLRRCVDTLRGSERLATICEFGCNTDNIAGLVRLLDGIDANKYAEVTRLVLEEDDGLRLAIEM